LWHEALGAGLLDLDEQHVLVAVGEELFHQLYVAGFLAFHPKLVARTAPIGGFFGAQRVAERLGVHEREHEHLPVAASCVMHGSGRRRRISVAGLAEFDLGVGGAGGKGHGVIRIEKCTVGKNRRQASKTAENDTESPGADEVPVRAVPCSESQFGSSS